MALLMPKIGARKEWVLNTATRPICVRKRAPVPTFTYTKK